MTIKIELSDATKLAIAKAVSHALRSECFLRCQPDRGDVFSWLDAHMPELSGVAASAAITAALEAMVKEGTAKVAVGYGVAPDSHWVAEVGLPDGEHTFPAIIIRLGGKP